MAKNVIFIILQKITYYYGFYVVFGKMCMFQSIDYVLKLMLFFSIIQEMFLTFTESSNINLRDISSYVRKAADFMETSAVTAVKLSDGLSTEK
jgi:hypothetical protein